MNQNQTGVNRLEMSICTRSLLFDLGRIPTVPWRASVAVGQRSIAVRSAIFTKSLSRMRSFQQLKLLIHYLFHVCDGSERYGGKKPVSGQWKLTAIRTLPHDCLEITASFNSAMPLPYRFEFLASTMYFSFARKPWRQCANLILITSTGVFILLFFKLWSLLSCIKHVIQDSPYVPLAFIMVFFQDYTT